MGKPLFCGIPMHPGLVETNCFLDSRNLHPCSLHSPGEEVVEERGGNCSRPHNIRLGDKEYETKQGQRQRKN